MITGYGPQENWKREEIVKAKSSEKLVYIQMDANSKLGPARIKGNPHDQSDNRKILTAIIKQNALFVVNNSDTRCKGKLTRRRNITKRNEERIIYFVITCEEMADMIEELVIAENKQYALSRYKKTKNGVKVV